MKSFELEGPALHAWQRLQAYLTRTLGTAER